MAGDGSERLLGPGLWVSEALGGSLVQASGGSGTRHRIHDLPPSLSALGLLSAADGCPFGSV